jgi:hypothetical protein
MQAKCLGHDPTTDTRRNRLPVRRFARPAIEQDVGAVIRIATGQIELALLDARHHAAALYRLSSPGS